MNSKCMFTNMVVLTACLAVLIFAGAIVSQKNNPARYTETITAIDRGELSFDMVLIPGGKFMMGSPLAEQGRAEHEGPQHEVQIHPFYLCTTETTMELFLAYYYETYTAKKAMDRAGLDAMAGPTPIYGELTLGYTMKHPAFAMTWHNAVTFCKWLSKKTGKEYRLPTEAEWEYAARAGTNHIYGFGDDPDQLKDFSWYEDNSDFEPHEVATKNPNPWGLYDMLGNVQEWVHDFYSPTAYEQQIKEGPTSGKVYVARGGYYDSTPAEVRCAARGFEEDWWRMNDPQMPKSKWWLPNMDHVGFRIARSVEADSKEKSEKLTFTSNKNGEYVFDTGILRGKLRQNGKSMGLSSVVHIPSGVRLDGRMGIFTPYRIFTTNKRYGSAAFGWSSTSKLLPDGAIQVTWPEEKDRPFEVVAIYCWRTSSMLELEITVEPRKDLSKFEVFLASYFNKSFPSSYVYVAKNPQAKGKPGFLVAEKSFGNWQIFPRNLDVVPVIQDGRWQKEPDPVEWAIMPDMQMPIGFRRSTKMDLTVILMAPQDDCFAIATPHRGERHYSLYLSLFGCDLKAGQTAKAHSRLIITTDISDSEILSLYQKYMEDIVVKAYK